MNSCTVKLRKVMLQLVFRRRDRFYSIFFCGSPQNAKEKELLQESRAVARKPRDVAAVVFGLKFADNITTSLSSQASKARLQSSKHTGAKHNLTQNGHSRSRVLKSVERR